MASPLWFAVAALILTLEIVVGQQNICKASDGRDGHPGAPGRDGRPGQKGDLGAPGLGAWSSQGFQGLDGPTPPPLGEEGGCGPKGQAGNLQDQPKKAFSASRKNPSPGVSPKTMVFDHSIPNQGNAHSTQTRKFTYKSRPPGQAAI